MAVFRVPKTSRRRACFCLPSPVPLRKATRSWGITSVPVVVLRVRVSEVVLEAVKSTLVHATGEGPVSIVRTSESEIIAAHSKTAHSRIERSGRVVPKEVMPVRTVALVGWHTDEVTIYPRLHRTCTVAIEARAHWGADNGLAVRTNKVLRRNNAIVWEMGLEMKL